MLKQKLGTLSDDNIIRVRLVLHRHDMGVIFCLSNQTGYSLLSIDETGKTALHYGARFGHKEIVKFIISSAPSPILDMVDEEKGKMIK